MKFAYHGVLILAFLPGVATAAFPSYFDLDRVVPTWWPTRTSLLPRVSEMEMRFGSVVDEQGKDVSPDPWPSDPVAGCADACCADPCCPGCCPGFYVFGEYLLWRAHRSCRPYVGLTTTGTFDPNENTVVEYGGVDFDWDSGLRVGFGHTMASCWDVAFTYTYFSNDGDAFTDDEDARLIPLGANPGWIAASTSLSTSPGVEEASAALGLDYHTFDIELGRQFQFCCSLTGRAFAGLRATQIDQESYYFYANVDSGTTIINAYDEVSWSSEMHGFGFRGGGSLNWNICGSCHWSLFSRTAVSLLLSEFEHQRTEVILDDASGLRGRLIATGECHDIVPVMELALGIRYDHGCCWLAAGYEFSTWFNMVNDIRFATDTNQDNPIAQESETQVIAIDRGNLSFDGLFVTAGVDF